MSEEKLFAVKNDEGKYFDCEYAEFLPLSESYCPVMVSEDNAKAIVHDYGGHIVTLIEEPKKVVLSKEQAEIVEGARASDVPASYISNRTAAYNGEERLLMNAYVNGYTVAKEKTWFLPVPSSWCGDSNHYWHKESDGTLTWSILSGRPEDFKFSEDEINKFELQDCEKEEVTDDDE